MIFDYTDWQPSSGYRHPPARFIDPLEDNMHAVGLEMDVHGEGADVPDSGRDADGETGYPGADMRGLVARMDLREQGRQQAVTRHGEPDPSLSVLENQQRADHTAESADIEALLSLLGAVSAPKAWRSFFLSTF